jgi:hypothetical protein
MATQEINKVIAEGIKLLEKYNSLIVEAGKNASKLAADAQKVNKTITDNSKATKKGTDTKKQYKKATSEAAKIQQQYQKTLEKVRLAEGNYSRALEKQKTLLTERKKLVKDQNILNDKQAGTLEKLAAKNRILVAERKKLNLETANGRKRLLEINSALDKNNKKITESSDAFTKTKRNIGNYQSALAGLPLPIQNVVTVTNTLKVALLTNPITAIIAAIAGAIALMTTALKRSQPAIEFFRKTFAQIKAVFDVLIDRVANFGETLFKIFKGEAKIKDLGKAFEGVNDEIREEVRLAKELEQALIDLEKAQTDAIITTARNRSEIAKSRLVAADQTKTTKERIDALREANALEQANSNIQQELQLRQIANILGITDIEKARTRVNELIESGNQLTLEEIGLSKSTEEDRKEANQAIAQLIELRTTEFTRRVRIVSQLSGLEKQLSNEQKKAAEDARINARRQAEAEQSLTKVQSQEFDERISNQDSAAEQQKEGLADLSSFRKKTAEQTAKAEQEFDKETAEKRKQLAEQEKARAIEFANTLFDSRIANLDRELQAAEGNEKKQLEIRQKIARAEKQKALFNIAINTAEGIVKALPNLVLAAIVGGIGATQAGIVASRPIPQFAKGVTNFGGGVAELAEEGPELVKESSGKVWLAENRGLYNLKQGTTVLTAQQTKSELNDKNITRELRLTRKAIINQPRPKQRSRFDERRAGYWDYYNSKNRF